MIGIGNPDLSLKQGQSDNMYRLRKIGDPFCDLKQAIRISFSEFAGLMFETRLEPLPSNTEQCLIKQEDSDRVHAGHLFVYGTKEANHL